MIDKRAAGPFNLAADPPVGRDDVATALGARPLHIPSGVLGALVDLSWRARLQHIDRGWLDLAFTVPLLDCSRARGELGWVPKWTSTDALADLLDGVAHHAHADSPPLRQRSMLDLLRRDVTDGLISSRRLPWPASSTFPTSRLDRTDRPKEKGRPYQGPFVDERPRSRPAIGSGAVVAVTG